VLAGGRKPYELERLVGGDAAADAEQNPCHADFLEGTKPNHKRWLRACVGERATCSGT
jgi:hypothetical protein